MASRLGDDDEFRNELSDDDDEESHQVNGDENSHGAQGRRAGSVTDADRGDNVISINGVDMNIDEYLAFSLAAAAAAQEDSMEQHAREANDHMEEMQQDGLNHEPPFDNDASIGLDGDYHENGNSTSVDHGNDHAYMSLSLALPPNDTGNSSESVTTDPSASIISALEKLNEAHGATDGHFVDDHSLNLPMQVDGNPAGASPAQTQPTTNMVDSHATLSMSAVSEGRESRKRKRTDEDEDESHPTATEETATTPATMGDFDDDEDDGDFVPEFEMGWTGDDTPGGLANGENAERVSPAEEDELPAQTQDSTMAQATQGAAQDVEDEDEEDEEEEEEDDEYFRIEEADYEDLFQPIEDVPIPVDDYQDIQAQYMQHLEEFNATMLREEMARRIADETAVGISMRAHHPSAASFPAADDDSSIEAQRQAAQAYQDTLESLGIAPDASQSQSAQK